MPPAPRRVKIELTARCEFQCFFCASHTQPREKTDMPREFYTRIVRDMRGLGIEQLGVFYLGESFLCSWLPDAIRYAKRECSYPHVFLTTNGRYATPDRVRACIRAGLDSLTFSCNYCGPQQFHDVTRVEANEYHTIVDNLKTAQLMRDNVLAETGHRCSLYASSLLYDNKQRLRMQAIVKDILPYVDGHFWQPLYVPAGVTASAVGTTPAAGSQVGAVAPRKPLPCGSLFIEGHITRDGRLSACCFDRSDCFNMGDLNRMSFPEAWHSKPFQMLREAHLRENVAGTACEKCVVCE